jgi:tetratricopeptide (TPR) repeat protein
MTSRMCFVFVLLAGSAAAQIDIDMSPAGAGVLEKKFNSSSDAYRNRSNSGVVTVAELSIPAKARKEFDNALESLQKQDLQQALRHLNKAVVIYPAFPGAYNNLGVVYARLGDTASERGALQKAIELNDHFALAYLNWARMSLASSDFAEADTALDKVSTLDPSDPTAEVLLAYSELMEGRLPEAVAASRKAHALQKPHAFAHRVAARAFEQQRQYVLAIEELQTFLKEDPAGPLANSVRQELGALKTASR